MTTAGKTYALKFISGKYQGGEFPLKHEKEIVIGRSSELDMVLVEDMVSRKHAKILVQADKIMIGDLGSTNGTFVNGEKIKQTRLKEGDRILIGTSILKLVVQDAPARPLDDKEIRDRMEQVAAAKPKSSGGAMSGRIEEVPLPDLLQLFQTSKKNGVLIVTSDDHEGRIYMRTGRVTYAVIDDQHDLGPRKSFYRVITWQHGGFQLSPSDGSEFPDELAESTEALLIEGLRQLDEFRRIEKDLPSRSARVNLPVPLLCKLRDLSPDELDVLQLVHNHGTVGQVLDHSERSDLDTALSLVELVQKGCVRRG